MTHSQHAPLSGPKPESDEATGLEAGGFMGQRTADSADCAATAKAFEMQRARLALRGFELHIVDDGEGSTAYLVRRWSMSRTLPSLADVQAFAERAGMPHG